VNGYLLFLVELLLEIAEDLVIQALVATAIEILGNQRRTNPAPLSYRRLVLIGTA
jgi:hypothetical protein